MTKISKPMYCVETRAINWEHAAPQVQSVHRMLDRAQARAEVMRRRGRYATVEIVEREYRYAVRSSGAS